MRDLNTFFKKYTSKVEIYREEKQDFERFLIFFNMKMSAKSNKVELSDELIDMWKEEQSPEVFCKKGVLRKFAKFTGKHLCQSLFLNTIAGLAKFLRTSFVTEHLLATTSKVWKECRMNFRFFQTDIFE